MPTSVDESGALPAGARESAGRGWLSRAASWAGWCVILVPVTIVLHELGHYTAAHLLGFPQPSLHYSHVHYDETGMRASLVGAVGLAGPAVTAVLALLACALIRLRGPARWVCALAIASASRFVVSVPYTVINIVVRLIGGSLRPPAFDEYKAGTALGWSGDVLLASTAIVLAVTVVCVGVALPRGERRVAWSGLLLGTAAGWALWMKVLGPALLP